MSQYRKPVDLSPKQVDSLLNGLRFVITGQFPQATRSEFVNLIKIHGGCVTGSVSGLTNYLLKGQSDHDSNKYLKAMEKGTTVIGY